MITTIIVLGVLVVVFKMGRWAWGFLAKRRRVQEEKRQYALQLAEDSGREKGMALAAATIDHILENGTDLEDITARTSEITSRWAEYDLYVYERQKKLLNSVGNEETDIGDIPCDLERLLNS